MTNEEKIKKIAEDTKVVMAFRKELLKETDRGCALMVGSYLEYELELLLKEKLVGRKKSFDDLFQFNGPLGTFSSKIKMCYAIGLISKETHDELELIRKIRNDFGHEFEAISFSTNQIKERINNLKQHTHPTTDRPKSVFINSSLGVLGQIKGANFAVDKFKEYQHNWISEEQKKELYERNMKLAEIIVKARETKDDTEL